VEDEPCCATNPKHNGSDEYGPLQLHVDQLTGKNPWTKVYTQCPNRIATISY
jgi:hypothetical protein